eukprot:TRINITY_DN30753_c0_g1_i1.p1 TRINITY_DN30753_c0_g1~~TRINITY_DN30753_c0_g1_i1.p1  ORF type:complete len:647 (-),score=63.46 TRINITY_DN30753_c0_g1_i1:100-2040(-)
MARTRKTHVACWNFANGSCRFGAKCRFVHAEVANENHENVKEISRSDTIEPALVADGVDMQELTAQFVELVDKVRNSKLLVEIDRVRQAESIYREKIATLESSLHASQDNFTGVTSRIGELEGQLQAQTSMIEELKRKLEASKVCLKAEVARVAGLQQELECTSCENDDLTKRLHSEVQKTETLEKQLASYQAEHRENPKSGAEWQFNVGDDEWSSFPADRSEELHRHFEEYCNHKRSPLLRMKSGVEEYEIRLDNLTQKNTKTGRTRPIRCTFHAPKHWTRSIGLQAIYGLEAVECVEVSGFRHGDMNATYYKCSGFIINGLPMWFNRTGDFFLYAHSDDYVGVTHVDKAYSVVRVGEELSYFAYLEGTSQPKLGQWKELNYETYAFEDVHTEIVQRTQIPAAPLLMNMVVEVFEDNVLSKLLTAIKGSVMHQHAHHGASVCDMFKANVRLTRVLRIENWHLWQKYKSHAEQVKRDMLKYGIAVKPVNPCLPKDLDELPASCCEGRLDAAINEHLLFHGTTYDTAVKIAFEGFDFRLSKPGYYGCGTYFASQACKSHQYTQGVYDINTMILSRVAVGDIHYASRVDKKCRRPPLHSGTLRCHDSIVANPGRMPGHHQRWQAHQEFVIFEKFQAYPEFIIQYALSE